MSRRMWTGILAGLLGFLVLAGVAAGAYRVGRDDTVVRTVGEGEAVRAVGHGWGYGPGPGFFLFPLLLLGIVALVVWGRRGWGDGRAYCGPAYGAGAEGAFSEWHRREHSDRPPTAAGAPGGRGETGPAPPTV